MTNKAEYPSDEMVKQWWQEAVIQSSGSYSIAHYVANKAIEWTLQGAEPVGWIFHDDVSSLADGNKINLYPVNSATVGGMKTVSIYTSPPAPELPVGAMKFSIICIEQRIANTFSASQIAALSKYVRELEALLTSEGVKKAEPEQGMVGTIGHVHPTKAGLVAAIASVLPKAEQPACKCYMYPQTVCDICQGVTGNEKDNDCHQDSNIEFTDSTGTHGYHNQDSKGDL